MTMRHLTYYMSIEDSHGRSKVHGYHIGTEIRLARALIEERFRCRTKYLMPTVSIALMLDGRVVDTFYGDVWHSNLGG